MKRKRESSSPSTSKPRPIPTNPSTTSRNIFTDLKIHDTTTWTCILSYLSMEDLESFSQTHPKMPEIVNTYLDRGNALVIDDNTLFKYPVQTHEYLYSKYSSRTKNLTISCTEEESGLLLVFPLFPTITQLTMRGLSNINIECFPLLKNLFLINNKEEDLLQHESLESLYLEGNPYLVLLDCPKLLNLTVLDQKLDGSHFKGTQLKRLTMESCWSPFDYSRVKSFTQLQLLRIVYPVNEKEKREIEDLNLTSTDFFCPEEENLILSLNDDCIRYFAEFLTTKDQLALIHSHSRFLLLHNSEYEIDRFTFKQVPLRANWNSYQVICPLMAKVNLTKLSEDVLKVLPLFKNLKELTIETEECRSDDEEPYFEGVTSQEVIQCIPNGIQKLFMKGQIIQESPDLSQLFRRLSPSLEVLELETTFPKYDDVSFDSATPKVPLNEIGLDHIKNLKEFKCRDLGISPELGRFLENNQETMTRLNINVRHDYIPLWRLLSTMKNLKYLTVRALEDFMTESPKLHKNSKTKGGNHLPLLEELVIVHHKMGFTYNDEVNGGILKFIKELDGQKLRTFEIRAEKVYFDATIFKRMANLEKLSMLCFRPLEWLTEKPNIFMLTKLKFLKVWFLKQNEVLPLVKGLPMLIDLDTVMDDGGKVKIDGNLMRTLKEYLQLADRRLRLNEEMVN